MSGEKLIYCTGRACRGHALGFGVCHDGQDSVCCGLDTDVCSKHAARPQPTGVAATLAERGSRYGKFTDHADVTQRLKAVMQHPAANWAKLADDQKEALEMIAHKIGRILSGDNNYADSWHDIAGYASLVDNRLAGRVL